MVTLVWFILRLFGICEFSWIPVLIDGAALTFICLPGVNDSTLSTLLSVIGAGLMIFAFYKRFFHLTLSAWWILITPFIFSLAAILPGGTTIMNLLFRRWGWISLPTWGLVVSIVLDVLFLIGCIMEILEARRNKTRNSHK